MTLYVGDIAPKLQTEIQNVLISLHEWAGSSWVFYFCHPADFTRVCTTEMGCTAQLADEFEKRNLKPLGPSTEQSKSIARDRRCQRHPGYLYQIADYC